MIARKLALVLLATSACVGLEVEEPPPGCAGDADCPPDSRCMQGGICEPCPAGFSLCGRACVDLRTDPASCGACDTPCGAPLLCSAGSCGCTAEGTADCDDGGGCRVLAGDDRNCGACGVLCGLDQSCVQGECRCPEGQQDCGAVGCCGEMLPVPAGEFWMGCDDSIAPGCEALGYTYRQATLPEFWIDRTEVTQQAWARCQLRAGCEEPTYVEAFDPPDTDAYPALVTWEEARSYCLQVGKRLPTEQEWERAARGTDGRLYPWGSAAPDCSLVNRANCNQTHRPDPVLSHEAGKSPVGALNMAGNVTEWVEDPHLDSCEWQGEALGLPPPHGELPGAPCQQVRGGDLTVTDVGLETFRRFSFNPGWPSGFRCASDP